jgi:signal transduction histidine kinase
VLYLTIDDDGPGIAAPDLERVFEPFVWLEASRSRETGGVRLGMSIALDGAGMAMILR